MPAVITSPGLGGVNAEMQAVSPAAEKIMSLACGCRSSPLTLPGKQRM
ncbi:MAG TPA: hypothetical protein VFO01_15270 [Trebonia sp.]|nr:hypothetical protein [Trebonia sp.]